MPRRDPSSAKLPEFSALLIADRVLAEAAERLRQLSLVDCALKIEELRHNVAIQMEKVQSQVYMAMAVNRVKD